LQIQQLQSQQYNFYYAREIPNKPPPPYTPPGDASLEDKASGEVPNSREQVLPFVLAVAEKFYHARVAGRDFESVQPPLDDSQDAHVASYKK